MNDSASPTPDASSPDASSSATPQGAPHLSVAGLACIRAERTVFTHVDFSIGPGEALVLVGPNGSGKSSLLRVIGGLVTPAAGRMVWCGADVADDPAIMRGQLHYAGHLDALKPAFNASEMLETWAALYGVAKAERADRALAALEAVSLGRLADTPVAFLSAGQKRRLGLARLLVQDRPLWLLDEPTVALDQRSVEEFAGIVARHREAGGFVIAATHLALGFEGAQSLNLGDHQPDEDMAA